MSCGQPIERRAVLAGREFTYELHRSARRRKSISLVVDDDRRLRVLAPKRTPLAQIDAFLQRRADWIREHLTAPPPVRLRDQLRAGGQLPLLGQPVAVAHHPSRFAYDGQRFLVNPADDNRCRDAEAWLREYARAEFTDCVDRWIDRIGVRPARIQIRDQKTRWGSASALGTLSFNWRLIFASPEIIEYVVVHELCHLIQPDHSPAYWRLVESHLPDYRIRRQALKESTDRLVW